MAFAGQFPLIAEIADEDGCLVVLDIAGWWHLTLQHPELVGQRAEIVRAIERPDHREPDPIAGRERYYLRVAVVSQWLQVVVECTEAGAQVVTAFPRRKDPPGWSEQ